MDFRRGDRTRTCDSLVPNQERYQLRYTPKNIGYKPPLFSNAVQRYALFLNYPNFYVTFCTIIGIFFTFAEKSIYFLSFFCIFSMRFCGSRASGYRSRALR